MSSVWFILKTRQAELRQWVIDNEQRLSYGGAGAINGPVFKDKEQAIRHHMLRRAFDLARMENAGIV